MFFSKSFGYALRGILYTAVACKEKQRIQVDEMARELEVPRHFLGKIMKKVVKHGILHSTKGPYGGFSLNEITLSTSLFELITITDGDEQFESCVLRLKKCNATRPCPLHHKMETFKVEMKQLLTKTQIGDLLNADQPGLIKSLSIIPR
jgi:Rrf2 family transcriptional regulator, iron-sulfur cluster assembly transcription factor